VRFGRRFEGEEVERFERLEVIWKIGENSKKVEKISKV
jgi:hypothetical protein